MSINKLKNNVMGLVALTGMVLAMNSCQMDQEAELEGPTQVELKPGMGPSNIAARINDVGMDGKEIFDVTEVQPNPPGGMEGWSNYLASNLSYPSKAREMGIEGTVIVAVLVNSDGSISNAEILRSIGGGCDEEVLRLLENSPKWSPAQQKGRAVNCRVRMPIKFMLG